MVENFIDTNSFDEELMVLLAHQIAKRYGLDRQKKFHVNQLIEGLKTYYRMDEIELIPFYTESNLKLTPG